MISLKLLTYNILFDMLNIHKRTNGIINIILNELPDIVALQEVNSISYDILKTNKNINKKYNFNKSQFNEMYGTLILSRFLIEEAITIPYNHTLMGRQLEYIKINVDGAKVIIATVHLESQFPSYKDKTEDSINSKVRTKISQYIETFYTLNQIKDHHIFMMGDTNISDKEEHIFETPYNYIDIYHHMGLGNLFAYTYDYKRNKMVKGRYQSRLDRIYYCNNTTNKAFEPLTYTLTGCTPLTSTGNCPSDHFGVIVECN
jgi:exonuclease III